MERNQYLILISAVILVSLIFVPVSVKATDDSLIISLSPPSSFIKGAALEIVGTAPNSSEIQIWLFKPNFINVIRKKTGAGGAFDIVLDMHFTDDLEAGSYIILVQSQGSDGQFDLLMNSTGDVINRKKTEAGGVLFTREQAEAMGDELAAQMVMGELNSSINDDPYEKFQVQIIDPFIRIDPIDNVCLGENVTISGTTNILAGEQLLIQLYRGLGETKVSEGDIELQSGPVTVQNGSSGINSFKRVIQYNSTVTCSGNVVVFVACCCNRTCEGTILNFSLLRCPGIPSENQIYCPTRTSYSPLITPNTSQGIYLILIAVIGAAFFIRRMKCKKE